MGVSGNLGSWPVARSIAPGFRQSFAPAVEPEPLIILINSSSCPQVHKAGIDNRKTKSLGFQGPHCTNTKPAPTNGKHQQGGIRPSVRWSGKRGETKYETS